MLFELPNSYRHHGEWFSEVIIAGSDFYIGGNRTEQTSSRWGCHLLSEATPKGLLRCNADHLSPAQSLGGWQTHVLVSSPTSFLVLPGRSPLKDSPTFPLLKWMLENHPVLSESLFEVWSLAVSTDVFRQWNETGLPSSWKAWGLEFNQSPGTYQRKRSVVKSIFQDRRVWYHIGKHWTSACDMLLRLTTESDTTLGWRMDMSGRRARLTGSSFWRGTGKQSDAEV